MPSSWNTCRARASPPTWFFSVNMIDVRSLLWPPPPPPAAADDDDAPLEEPATTVEATSPIALAPRLLARLPCLLFNWHTETVANCACGFFECLCVRKVTYKQIAFLVQRTALLDGPLLFAAAVQPQSQQTFAGAAHCATTMCIVCNGWYLRCA